MPLEAEIVTIRRLGRDWWVATLGGRDPALMQVSSLSSLGSPKCPHPCIPSAPWASGTGPKLAYTLLRWPGEAVDLGESGVGLGAPPDPRNRVRVGQGMGGLGTGGCEDISRFPPFPLGLCPFSWSLCHTLNTRTSLGLPRFTALSNSSRGGVSRCSSHVQNHLSLAVGLPLSLPSARSDT